MRFLKFIFIILNGVYVSVSVRVCNWSYIQVVVSYPMWVLGPEFRSGRAGGVLDAEPSPQSLIGYFFFFKAKVRELQASRSYTKLRVSS